MLYSYLLPLHNILRWLVLAAALFAILRALAGWLGKKAWTRLDDSAGLWFTILLDVQVLVGLVLYFVASPLMQTALKNFGAAMQNADLRFFAVEHILVMLAGAAAAHVGRSLARKAADPAMKHRRAAMFFGAALLLILAAVPWPFSAVARPLIRF